MVRILALETTELKGTLAAMEDGRLLAQTQLNPEQRSAQSLAPGIAALLHQVGWQPHDVGLVAVVVGPGSFTGVRVGVTTAKVFAYAASAKVIAVDTLETIAAAAPDEVPAVSVAVGAQRGDVVARSFRRADDGWFEPQAPAALLPVGEWLAGLPTDTWVSGPALRTAEQSLPPSVRALPSEFWSPQAAQAARLADRAYRDGRCDDLWQLAPVYSRRSAAEEKWEQKHRRP